ncbi:MAG: 30S ribosomal protein S11, partial [Candidatus Sungbacteria bacterium]|nr:30S ribosomal protein S11 [Candidatus Sungbacteria bacterium]
ERMPYRRISADFTVAQGVMETKNLVLDSEVVRVSGVGSGRDSAIRSLANHGLNIISIKDVTPLPHNGPRSRKVRRV